MKSLQGFIDSSLPRRQLRSKANRHNRLIMTQKECDCVNWLLCSCSLPQVWVMHMRTLLVFVC